MRVIGTKIQFETEATKDRPKKTIFVGKYRTKMQAQSVFEDMNHALFDGLDRPFEVPLNRVHNHPPHEPPCHETNGIGDCLRRAHS